MDDPSVPEDPDQPDMPDLSERRDCCCCEVSTAITGTATIVAAWLNHTAKDPDSEHIATAVERVMGQFSKHFKP